MAKNGGFISGTVVPDDFVVGTEYYTEPGVLNENETIERGTVLGKITSGGNMRKSLSASSDGSEVPYAIALDEAVTAGGENENIPMLVAGQVNQNNLDVGAGHTLASIKAGLRDKGIHFVDTTEVE